MPNPGKPIFLGAVLAVGMAIAASAAPPGRAGDNMAAPVATEPSGQSPGPQVAALPPASATAGNITLPEVTVVAPQPYSSGGGPRLSSYSKPRSEHYSVSPDYAANPALHPYTSGLGPRASSNHTVRTEHYQVPPDYDSNIAMHPYTSAIGPCPQGGTGKVVCTDMIPASHHNH
jgi:hypothetical protein